MHVHSTGKINTAFTQPANRDDIDYACTLTCEATSEIVEKVSGNAAND